MMEFGVRSHGLERCAMCDTAVSHGYTSYSDGIPHFFQCVSCVYNVYSAEDVQAALDRHNERIWALRQAQVEEDHWRDEGMRAWLDVSEAGSETSQGAA